MKAKRDESKLPNWAQKLIADLRSAAAPDLRDRIAQGDQQISDLSAQVRELQKRVAWLSAAPEGVVIGVDFIMPLAEVRYVEYYSQDRAVLVLRSGEKFKVTKPRSLLDALIVWRRKGPK